MGYSPIRGHFRSLLKQTYALTAANLPYRKFLTLTYRLSAKDFSELEISSQKELLAKFAALLSRINELKTKNKAEVQKKYELMYTYLSHPFIKIDVEKDLAE